MSMPEPAMSGFTLRPGRDRLIAYLRFLGLFYLAFFPAYAGIGWFTGLSGRAYDLYLPAERAIPLVPWMVWPYLSLYPLFLLPLFHLTPERMARLSRQSLAVIGIAAIAFLVVPGRLGYEPSEPGSGLTGFLLEAIRTADTPHNTVPSLHVAFTCLILLACAEGAPRGVRLAYLGWAGLLSLSTLLIHQHHLLDVAAGAGLALAIRPVMPLGGGPAGR